MQVQQRVTLFSVETTRFRNSCLPKPTTVITDVNCHLPKQANERNENLLKTIKVTHIPAFFLQRL